MHLEILLLPQGQTGWIYLEILLLDPHVLEDHQVACPSPEQQLQLSDSHLGPGASVHQWTAVKYLHDAQLSI